MSGSVIPGLTDDLGPPIVIDDGTLARAASDLPGPIGLDAGAGAPAAGASAIAERTVSFARGKIGERFGDGQCFDLVDKALRAAGAKSAADFGTVAKDVDYVWGSAIALADVKGGDVIQFRGYRYDRTIDTPTATDTDFQERPHHTAIVESVDGNGALTVLEQNAPDGASAQRAQLFFVNVDSIAGGRTTRIVVRGRVRFFRPQARR